MMEVKEYGEIYTPIQLVDILLNDLPNDIWFNPNLKWLDPSNGKGAFLFNIIQRLMISLKNIILDDKMRYKHIIENMIYSCEIQSKNNIYWKNLIDPNNEYKLNLYEGDFIEMILDKYDIILGNPPYQKGKNSNYYVKFIDKFEYISNEKSILMFVTPNRFFHTSHKAHKSIERYKIHKLYHNLNKYFDGVSTHIGSFLLSKEQSNNDTIQCVLNNDIIYIDFKIPMPTNPIYSTIGFIEIINKITSINPKLNFIKEKPICGIFIKRQWKRWNSINEIGGDHVFNCLDNGIDGKWLECFDKIKMEWYLSKSNVIRFISKAFASAMNVPPFLWNIIPAINLNDIESNLDLYNYFKLTFEEIKLIESTIK